MYGRLHPAKILQKNVTNLNVYTSLINEWFYRKIGGSICSLWILTSARPRSHPLIFCYHACCFFLSIISNRSSFDSSISSFCVSEPRSDTDLELIPWTYAMRGRRPDLFYPLEVLPSRWYIWCFQQIGNPCHIIWVLLTRFLRPRIDWVTT